MDVPSWAAGSAGAQPPSRARASPPSLSLSAPQPPLPPPGLAQPARRPPFLLSGPSLAAPPNSPNSRRVCVCGARVQYKLQDEANKAKAAAAAAAGKGKGGKKK